MVKMNKEILEIINTVINYKKYLVGYHIRILKNKNYDYISKTENFYYSLPLPNGMNKNIQDFENLINYSRSNLLTELNNLSVEDLGNYYWKNY